MVCRSRVDHTCLPVSIEPRAGGGGETLDGPLAERYESGFQGTIICAADEILTGVP
jgi:hypothetical protein